MLQYFLHSFPYLESFPLVVCAVCPFSPSPLPHTVFYRPISVVSFTCIQFSPRSFPNSISPIPAASSHSHSSSYNTASSAHNTTTAPGTSTLCHPFRIITETYPVSFIRYNYIPCPSLVFKSSSTQIHETTLLRSARS